jgi:endoglucanase
MTGRALLILIAGCGGGTGPAAPDAARDAVVDAPLAETSVFRGVNLAGAEFGETNLPGTYDVDYIYPTAAEVDYFQGAGMNVVRLPFRWERLQRTLEGDLDPTEVARLDGFVAHAIGRGVAVILDPHNYARYHGEVVGGGVVSRGAYADLWRRLADRYPDDLVIYGLMNEPHDMATEDWLAAANHAIAAIRGTGSDNLILVPGNAWTGAHGWFQDWYGTPNATVMADVVDPTGPWAIEIHQYLDADYSGRAPECQSTTIGSEQLAPVTTWARERGIRLFLGELGGSDQAICLAAIDDMLDHVDANLDVWRGWTWWAAGPWWGDYMFSIAPRADGSEAAQMAVLRAHLP